jgi:hypothetical protein
MFEVNSRGSEGSLLKGVVSEETSPGTAVGGEQAQFDAFHNADSLNTAKLPRFSPGRDRCGCLFSMSCAINPEFDQTVVAIA